jgi:hypothetical protein
MINGNSPYGLKYDPDTEVYALPETMGVMCFQSRKWAEKWLKSHWFIGLNNIIVEVIPMGKGHMPKVVANPKKLDLWYNDIKAYRRIHLHPFLTPPDGTICYPAVYVVN